MLTVQIVLFDGFDLLDAIAPYEVFYAAGMFADGAIEVEFVTANGPALVRSGINGLKMEASSRLRPDRAGIILVPGAAGELEGDGPNSIPAILARAANTELTGMLAQALRHPGIVVATVCGGSVVLGLGGLLEGRPAVTNHLGMGLLGAMGAIPVKARIVDDGNLVTGGGVTSGLDIALHLVEHELGPRISHAVEQLFEWERRGTVWRNSGISPRHGSLVSEPNAAMDSSHFPGVSPNDLTQVSDFDGEWDTTIVTPLGRLSVKLHITTLHGVIQGTATHADEENSFINPLLTAKTLCWSQRVTKPMRLNLNFEVTVEGDHMIGIVKAGVLPASPLQGKRI